jgi:ADP-dependent NAD(P)H-hydrate dehydratase / NAD(P)H-hydrate epimerase
MPSSASIARILGSGRDWPLHDVAAARGIEQRALGAAAPHALMRRAGLGVARLALAVAPHSHRVWVACGPGNNGGDGLEAAAHLHRLGRQVIVTLAGDAARMPDDARDALARAQSAGVPMQDHLALPFVPELCVDALLGLGASRAPQGAIAEAIAQLNALPAPCMAVDLPSGLHADSGRLLGQEAVRARHTLSLLPLKPGLFTAQGRDHAGQVWLDSLDVDADGEAPSAWLIGALRATPPRLHSQHKGSYGDVAVVGGAPGMVGAAWLAARAAHAAGAGRVYVSPLDADAPAVDMQRLELMVRRAWWTSPPELLRSSTVVCGCGGGAAVREVLPVLLSRCERLVLDADALNAVAEDEALRTLLTQRARRAARTVLTPHPLEAARLLASSAAEVQSDRLAAAKELCERLSCTVLLKGSGSVIATPGRPSAINASGNALLATAGTGDVLAGWIGGLWAQQPGEAAFDIAAAAAHRHGQAADAAAARGETSPLRADDLIDAMRA